MNDPVEVKSNCLGALIGRLRIGRLRFAFIPPSSWENCVTFCNERL